MDDGELELSHLMSPTNPDIIQGFEEFLRNTRTCTHTHTCNPPGPDAASHTHTCYHTHTQVLETSEGDTKDQVEATKKSRKPLGNREAVRKYREKKKAHTAYLEEEVKKLRLLNQQLLRKLQNQPALEAEVIRLRSLLVDLRGKIDAELGAFPFQKQCNTAGLQCEVNGQCFSGNAEIVGWEGSCVPEVVNCQFNPTDKALQNVISMDGCIGSLVSSASPAV